MPAVPVAVHAAVVAAVVAAPRPLSRSHALPLSRSRARSLPPPPLPPAAISPPRAGTESRTCCRVDCLTSLQRRSRQSTGSRRWRAPRHDARAAPAAAAAVAWSGPGAVRGGTAVPERPHASSPRGRRARLSAVRRLRTRVCAKSTETALDRVLARARVGRAAAGVGREPRAEARLSVSIVGQPSHRGHLINGGTQRLRDKLLRLASSALAIARGGPRTCLGTGAHAQVEVVAVVVAHLVR